jgi:hypothetical protein
MTSQMGAYFALKCAGRKVKPGGECERHQNNALRPRPPLDEGFHWYQKERPALLQSLFKT